MDITRPYSRGQIDSFPKKKSTQVKVICFIFFSATVPEFVFPSSFYFPATTPNIPATVPIIAPAVLPSSSMKQPGTVPVVPLCTVKAQQST